MAEKVNKSSKRGGKRAGAGRKAGVPNKITADVRAVFAGIMERNASKAEQWIERVADSDPYKATDLLLRMAEFHVPKLARTEHTGKGGGALLVKLDATDDGL